MKASSSAIVCVIFATMCAAYVQAGPSEVAEQLADRPLEAIMPFTEAIAKVFGNNSRNTGRTFTRGGAQQGIALANGSAFGKGPGESVAETLARWDEFKVEQILNTGNKEDLTFSLGSAVNGGLKNGALGAALALGSAGNNSLFHFADSSSSAFGKRLFSRQ